MGVHCILFFCLFVFCLCSRTKLLQITSLFFCAIPSQTSRPTTVWHMKFYRSVNLVNLSTFYTSFVILYDKACAHFEKYHRPLGSEVLTNGAAINCTLRRHWWPVAVFLTKCRPKKRKCVKLWISALTITVFDVTHPLILSACRMPTGPSGDICVTQAGRKKRMWCACACVCLCVFVYDREIIPVHVLIECFLFKASWWAWSFQLAACVRRREWETARVVIVAGRKATGPKNAL